MKKLALLLGSLLVVASTASAKEVMVAPVEEIVIVPIEEEVVVVNNTYTSAKALKADSVSFWTENDNTAGGSDYGSVYFGTNFKFSSENWKYEVEAYKAWELDSDEGVMATGNRLQVGAMRSFNKDGKFKFAVGPRVRLQTSNITGNTSPNAIAAQEIGAGDTYDRYYLDSNYSYGMLSGWATVAYTAYTNSGEADSTFVEVMPLNLSYKGFKLGYFFTAENAVGHLNAKEIESVTEHQIRFYFPIYSSDKLTVKGEYRLGLGEEAEYKDDPKGTRDSYKAGKYHYMKLAAEFPVTENSTIGTYYLYEILSPETGEKALPKNVGRGENGDKRNKNDYYGEFGLGWTYNF